MIFATPEGNFGFVVAKLPGQHMFQFQLILDGHLVGDREPCIIGSAMAALGELPCLEDQELDLLPSDPASVASFLDSDAELHDATTLSIAESLDCWWLRGYVHGGAAVILARERRQGQSVGEFIVSVVSWAEYKDAHGAAYDYWLSARELM